MEKHACLSGNWELHVPTLLKLQMYSNQITCKCTFHVLIYNCSCGLFINNISLNTRCPPSSSLHIPSPHINLTTRLLASVNFPAMTSKTAVFSCLVFLLTVSQSDSQEKFNEVHLLISAVNVRF